MGKPNKQLVFIFAIVILVIVFVFGVYAVTLYKNSTDNVKAASIAAFVTVGTFLLGRYFEQSRELRQRVNSEKIEVYKMFLEIYFNAFSSQKPGGRSKPTRNWFSSFLNFKSN